MSHDNDTGGIGPPPSAADGIEHALAAWQNDPATMCDRPGCPDCWGRVL
ncbi:hypothetical protein [Spongiactinospora sp. TRM90649]|nr:hypothetical protein [Spongiactinospora sp. TRM90649]MDF5758640.1 hypothetical protein [Spongiactinospora sp. TRM90649]